MSDGAASTGNGQDRLRRIHTGVLQIAGALEALRQHGNTPLDREAAAAAIRWLSVAAQGYAEGLAELSPFVGDRPIEFETECNYIEFAGEPEEGRDARPAIVRDYRHVATPMSYHHHVVEVAAWVFEVFATQVEFERDGTIPPVGFNRLMEAAAVVIESFRLPDIQRLTGRLYREYLLAARMEAAGRQTPPPPGGATPADGTRNGQVVWIRGEPLDLGGEQIAALFELIVRSTPTTDTERR
jgi:hypothetical protein